MTFKILILYEGADCSRNKRQINHQVPRDPWRTISETSITIRFFQKEGSYESSLSRNNRHYGNAEMHANEKAAKHDSTVQWQRTFDLKPRHGLAVTSNLDMQSQTASPSQIKWHWNAYRFHTTRFKRLKEARDETSGQTHQSTNIQLRRNGQQAQQLKNSGWITAAGSETAGKIVHLTT